MSILSVFREPAKVQRPVRYASISVFPPSIIFYAVWISTHPRQALGAGIVGLIASCVSFLLALCVLNFGQYVSPTAAEGAIALPISSDQQACSFHAKESESESDEASTPVAGPSGTVQDRSLRSSSIEVIGALTRAVRNWKTYSIIVIDAALFLMNLGAVTAVDVGMERGNTDSLVLSSYVSMFLMLNTLIHLTPLVLGTLPALYSLLKSFTLLVGKRTPKKRVLCSNCRAIVGNPTAVDVERAATRTQVSGTVFRDEETVDADAEQLLIGADGEVSSMGSNGLRDSTEEPPRGEWQEERRGGRDDDGA